MTAYVTVDDCVPKDLYLCVRDQCSRTVASVKAKLHLVLRPYYILTGTLTSQAKIGVWVQAPGALLWEAGDDTPG